MARGYPAPRAFGMLESLVYRQNRSEMHKVSGVLCHGMLGLNSSNRFSRQCGVDPTTARQAAHPQRSTHADHIVLSVVVGKAEGKVARGGCKPSAIPRVQAASITCCQPKS